MDDFVLQLDSTRVSTAPEKHASPQAGPTTLLTSSSAHDDIARRAYDIYDKNGRQQGQCQQNWQQAERELRKQSVTVAPHEPTEAPSALPAGSEPVVKTLAEGDTIMSGKTDVAKGRIKEAAGVLTGSEKLRAEGKTDQAIGEVKQVAEKAVDKVKQAVKKVRK